MTSDTHALSCNHPRISRWQHRGMWECCQCGRSFWGDKKALPACDIYGNTFMEHLGVDVSHRPPLPLEGKRRR